MAFCKKCGAALAAGERFCRQCGADGAALARSAPGAVAAPAPARQAMMQAAPMQAAYPPCPPGMVPVVYQAYPGGPQQVYYVPAQGTHAHGTGFLEGVRSKIRSVASSEKLEGFSLRKTFSETFKRHGPDAVEDYCMVGSARTTPPIELVDTGWPRPWMFFRLLAAFLIAAAVLFAVWMYTSEPGLIPAILFLGVFTVPLAVLVFIYEMNTPRNVSVVLVEKLFILGGLAGMCMALIEYQIPVLDILPGPVEETAKLLAVVLLMRGVRYKYELNGILFGCAVGAGFACFETFGYALGLLGGSGFLQAAPQIAHAQHDLASAKQALQAAAGQGAIQAAQQALKAAQTELKKAYSDGVVSMLTTIVARGILAPFGHPVWTAISAGAFWRVKRDRPTKFSMLFNGRFLMAFAIPVLMHTLWDISVDFPSVNPFLILGFMLGTAIVSWYVLFTLIQQGLHQVRAVQVAQLQSTLAHVEATMQPVAGTYAVQPRGPANF